MKATPNPKYGQLLEKAFEKYKNLEYLNPHDEEERKSDADIQDPEPESKAETKCAKTDMFHDILVKVRGQDSLFEESRLGDFSLFLSVV